MTLWRFGPKRLSPSLVVWQVRHALLNVSCPDSVSASLRADSWGTAENPRSISNVAKANPETALRGITSPIPLASERPIATIRSSLRAGQSQFLKGLSRRCGSRIGDNASFLDTPFVEPLRHVLSWSALVRPADLISSCKSDAKWRATYI